MTRTTMTGWICQAEGRDREARGTRQSFNNQIMIIIRP
jgi:hypothetical protein